MENINRFKRGVKAFTGPSRNPQNASELQMQQWVKQIERINTQHTAERAQKDLTQIVNSIVENADLVQDLIYNKDYKDQISYILNFDFAQDGNTPLVLAYERNSKFKGLDFKYTIVYAEVRQAVGFCEVMPGNNGWLHDALKSCGVNQKEPIESFTAQVSNTCTLAEVLRFISEVEVSMQDKQNRVCSAVAKHKQKLVERIKAAGFSDSQIQLVQSFW